MTTIHRDHTFEYDGHRYRALNGGPGWGWEVHTEPEAWGTDLENHFTLRELRAELDHRAANGWPIIHLRGGDRLMYDGGVYRVGGIDIDY